MLIAKLGGTLLIQVSMLQVQCKVLMLSQMHIALSSCLQQEALSSCLQQEVFSDLSQIINKGSSP